MISHYISLGRYKGFNIESDGPALRFNLGYITFAIGFFSIEDLLGDLIYDLKKLEGHPEKIKEQYKKILLFKKENDTLKEQITALKKKNNILVEEIEDLELDYADYQDKLDEVEALRLEIDSFGQEIDFIQKYFNISL